jgi:pSer/pThr/pTyr-binding forkhead associated (FHA) protein
MSEQLLGVFKLCLLGLLYLFFARVLWAVWSEVRPQQTPPQMSSQLIDQTGSAPAPQPAPRPKSPKKYAGPPTRLVVVEPTNRRGAVYLLDRELSVGRTPNCGIALPDDGFVSTLHARLFLQDDDVFVEDLNSTNGTFLNGQRITRVNRLAQGDRVQFGNTVLEGA